ncbi:MAG: nicotinate-nucleotide--dimethylbenzimidazole phosphoribosyltransferase, partial [Ruminococcus sp.]|nr:nicotinate-nucleotide--dimethylbenzimidazole phosphoribosyltransferase [Ruminococcus sp.]
MDRISRIIPTDKAAYNTAKMRWNSIAKPLGSFGILEEMVQKIAAVQGTPDVDISKRTAVIMCGDHGVVSEGVTQCGQEVTAECAKAIAEGRSNV